MNLLPSPSLRQQEGTGPSPLAGKGLINPLAPLDPLSSRLHSPGVLPPQSCVGARVFAKSVPGVPMLSTLDPARCPRGGNPRPGKRLSPCCLTGSTTSQGYENGGQASLPWGREVPRGLSVKALIPSPGWGPLDAQLTPTEARRDFRSLMEAGGRDPLVPAHNSPGTPWKVAPPKGEWAPFPKKGVHLPVGVRGTPLPPPSAPLFGGAIGSALPQHLQVSGAIPVRGLHPAGRRHPRPGLSRCSSGGDHRGPRSAHCTFNRAQQLY
ncbi:hypothetical protein GWK47_013628 [Chionoecetes opilio]|uniref:Uncharacterized protein n=1 Tax=Chionoecetes opilio TaxID=41210 RepID=A0A8J4XUI0_CHIOP|nr:hypothetical protein GWK47_013628 [Chionoecetes opilio]